MDTTSKNFPFFYESNCDQNLYGPACATWHTQFEKELKEHAVRLLQCRAGGRLSMFEAGMLYNICLCLGMKDSRWKNVCEQEEYWRNIVGSCDTEADAKKALAKLLKNGQLSVGGKGTT